MIELSSLSKLGFGAYRVRAGCGEHSSALCHALRSGCNLIDTSANYGNGESERLIGETLRDNPDLDAFVITKAGYAQGDNLGVLEGLCRRGIGRDEAVALADDHHYSIHPSYLRTQWKRSSERLQVQRIDALLLHNPEQCRAAAPGGCADADEYYGRIERAFVFFEELVQSGSIRYYGISSNTLTLSDAPSNGTNLRQVIAAAKRVSASHHFKIVQMPFNMLESAAADRHIGSTSLLDAAKAHGLVTIANRPLNANTQGGSVRIATYPDEVAHVDLAGGGEVFAQCVRQVGQRLKSIGAPDGPMDFMVMQFLRDNWPSVRSPDGVAAIFEQQVYPFLEALYDGEPSTDAVRAFQALRSVTLVFARRCMSAHAEKFRRGLIESGRIRASDLRPLAQIACEHCIQSGIDHVLVGMRTVNYVDTLKMLF